MHVSKRSKLHFGPYRTPRFRYGAIVTDEIRGDVQITQLSNARIPWPLAKKKGRRPTPLVNRTLARAIRLESTPAIRYWFGLTAWQASVWRSALGAEANNPGTLRLRQAHAESPWFKRAQKLGWAKARDPERIAKIAAAKRGKQRPWDVIEAMRRANLGRPLSAEHRQKMSEAHKRRGTKAPAAGRPWARWEDALLYKLPIRDVVAKTGRTEAAVKHRRKVLRFPDGRRKENRIAGAER
jgi:NUMOD3 motif